MLENCARPFFSVEMGFGAIFEKRFLYKKSSLRSNYLPVTSGPVRVVETKPNIGQNLWVLAEDPYGLWVIVDLWVMGHDLPQTNLVDKIFYGVSGVMGYERYGLGWVRL